MKTCVAKMEEKGMKTPEEIKNGLICCQEIGGCQDCPYGDGEDAGDCLEGHLEDDALTYIQQLETNYSQVSKALCGKENSTLDEVLQAVDQLKSRLAQAERERDAAVQDVWKSCEYCKHSYMNNSDVDICPHAEYCSPTNDKWEWRGVFPENTKEDENGN